MKASHDRDVKQSEIDNFYSEYLLVLLNTTDESLSFCVQTSSQYILSDSLLFTKPVRRFVDMVIEACIASHQ